MDRLACTWCKQIYPAREMRTRRGWDICEWCNDQMLEYAEDAKREQWEQEQDWYARLEDGKEDYGDESNKD